MGRTPRPSDIISFEGETVAQLRADFQAAIDEFLRDCTERGRCPGGQGSPLMVRRYVPGVTRQAG